MLLPVVLPNLVTANSNWFFEFLLILCSVVSLSFSFNCCLVPPIAPAPLCTSQVPYAVYFLPCPYVNIIVHLQVWGQNFSILFGSPRPQVVSLHTHTHTPTQPCPLVVYTYTHTKPLASGLNCHPTPTPLTWASIVLSLLCFYEFQHELFPCNHFTLLNHSTIE